jgi:hypothetical protein
MTGSGGIICHTLPPIQNKAPGGVATLSLYFRFAAHTRMVRAQSALLMTDLQKMARYMMGA